jgi:hypothetical protein
MGASYTEVDLFGYALQVAPGIPKVLGCLGPGIHNKC